MASRIGFLVNPVAGLGGRVGLKGTDGASILAAALARGARPLAHTRAVATLRALAAGEVRVLTAGGAMGEQACLAAGIDHETVYRPVGDTTSAADTRAAVRVFVEKGCDLVLFAGGDGTARDVHGVVANRVAMLGIPAGVKMYSGVFALTPVHAGILTTRFQTGTPLAEREVLDIDEESLRRGRPSTRLHGYALVPADPAMQAAKSSASLDEQGDLNALCRAAAARLEPDFLHIVGPGSSMQRLLAEAGHEGTLLGVDLLTGGALIGRDVDEDQILAALKQTPGCVHVGVIGGTGCLFGRGNQQISANVLSLVPRDRICVLAPPAKLASLGSAGFFVDTGDPEVDGKLSGYIKVNTAPGRQMLMKVRSAVDGVAPAVASRGAV